MGRHRTWRRRAVHDGARQAWAVGVATETAWVAVRQAHAEPRVRDHPQGRDAEHRRAPAHHHQNDTGAAPEHGRAFGAGGQPRAG